MFRSNTSHGSTVFHWTPFGGMIGGRRYGPFAAATFVIVGPIMYGIVILSTIKLRHLVPSCLVPRWRFIHNGFMSIFSGSIVVACVIEIYRSTTSNGPWLCSTVETRRFDIIQTSWLVSKAYEWVDTIFLLLQHKQPILLHLWHHASTLVFFGLLSPYSHLSKMGILVNGSIHAVMYAHYAKPFPRWARRWVTRIQILQFSVAMIWALVAQKKCFMERNLVFSELLGHFIVGSYLVLFVHFYVTDKSRRRKIKLA